MQEFVTKLARPTTPQQPKNSLWIPCCFFHRDSSLFLLSVYFVIDLLIEIIIQVGVFETEIC